MRWSTSRSVLPVAFFSALAFVAPSTPAQQMQPASPPAQNVVAAPKTVVAIGPPIRLSEPAKGSLGTLFKQSAQQYKTDKDLKKLVQGGASLSGDAREVYNGWAYAFAAYRKNKMSAGATVPKAQAVPNGTATPQQAPWNYVIESATATLYTMNNCSLAVALDLAIKNKGGKYPVELPAPSVWSWGPDPDPYLVNTNWQTAPKILPNEQRTMNVGVIRGIMNPGHMTATITDPNCVGAGASPAAAQTAGWILFKGWEQTIRNLWRVRWGGALNPTITVHYVEPPPPDDFPFD